MSNVTKQWDYAGDGVYALFDEAGGIWLHANSHDEPTDKIYLEPEVINALDKLREKYHRKAQ